MLPLLVFCASIAGAWYLLIVRPQREQQTRHGRIVEQLQVGDHVLTVGGIYGQVIDVTPTSVELRLGPAATTRIATDGIARVVHATESNLTFEPAAAPTFPPHDTVDTMQHPPQQHPQHTQFAQPAQAAPAPSGFAPPPLPAFAPQPVGHAPMPGTTTLRAQVLPGSAPVTAPWSDVAPAGQAAAARPLSSGFQLPPPPVLVAHRTPTAMPHASQQQAPPQLQAPQGSPAQPPGAPAYAPAPGHAQPQGFALSQPPLHAAPAYAVAQPMTTPFAPASPPPAQPQYAPAPVQYAPAPVQYAAAPAAAPQAPSHPESAGPLAPGRRHSRAPQGMGSSLRLDDPSLVDTMSRARQERAGLAEEYRQAIAPLVDVTPHQQHAPAQTASYPQDPAGLYAAPQQHLSVAAPMPTTPQPVYPAPARSAGTDAATMPRPVISPGDGVHDPAFQRRTPMTQSAPSVYPAPAASAPTPTHA